MENKTKKEMDEVITELKKFTSRVSTKHDPVDPALIGRFESRFGLKLPEDYKYLLGITNGFSVMGNEVLGMTDESYSYDLYGNSVSMPPKQSIWSVMQISSSPFSMEDLTTSSISKTESSL